MFTIYCHTNKANGKRYIGQTMRPLKVRMNAHKNQPGRYFHSAVKKHGWAGFDTEILSRVPTKTEANSHEQFWIVFFDTTNAGSGYNLTRGGEGTTGRKTTPETLAKLRGRKASPEALANMRAAQKGTKPSAQCQAAKIEANRKRKGEKHWWSCMTPEHKTRLAAICRNRKGEKRPPCTDAYRASQRAAWTPERRAAQAQRIMQNVNSKIKGNQMADTYDNSELVKETQNQTDPHRAVASDFKVTGPLGKVGEVPAGKDQLTPCVEETRHCEDDGPGESGAGTPTGGDWGAASKGKAFKVETNKGEGDSAPSKMSIPYSVDFASGQISPNVEGIRNHEA